MLTFLKINNIEIKKKNLISVCVGDDKATRKGQVLMLLAEQALQFLDFKTSYIHCQDLMAAGMSDAQISAGFIMVVISTYYDFPTCFYTLLAQQLC